MNRQFPRRLDRQTLIGGAFWLLSLEFLAGQVIAASAWKGTQYSVVNDAISDLGVTVCGTVNIGGVPGYYCSPLHDVMNASFVFTGACIVLGVYLIRSAWPWSRKMRYGFTLLTLAGIGKAIAGLNPANVNFTLHSLGSLGIPVGDFGLILVGLAFLGKARRLGAFSLTLGVAGALGFAYFLVGKSAPWVVGASRQLSNHHWCAAPGLCFVLWSRRSAPTRFNE